MMTSHAHQCLVMYPKTKVITCRVPELTPDIPPLASDASTARADQPRRTIGQTRRRDDGDDWSKAHDPELDRHEEELCTWHYKKPKKHPHRQTDPSLSFSHTFLRPTLPETSQSTRRGVLCNEIIFNRVWTSTESAVKHTHHPTS